MDAPLAAGTLLDHRYRVVGVAKRGAFGQTYLARDQKQMNELCVLKEFIPEQQDPAIITTLLQLFHNDAAILYELRHPQLPRPRAMIAENGRFYWVREYVEGKSYGVILESRRTQGQVFSEAEVVQLMLQVLPILSYLHSRGVVHGNLSLDSLILRQKDQLPVLINYGLVRDLVMRLQLHPVKSEEALLPWGYTPPEKFSEGQVYPNSDLYSLGVVAIALLTSKPPEELYNQTSQTFNWEPFAAVNPKLARVLQQMLDVRPTKRFASANQAIQALEPLAEAPAPAAAAIPVTQTVVAEPVPSEPAPVPPSRKRSKKKRPRSSDPRASAALVVGLALLAGVVAWKVISSNRSDRPSDSASAPVEIPTNPPASSPVEPAAPPSPKAESLPPQPIPATPKSAPQSPAAQPGTTANSNALRDRLQTLGINSQYFSKLVDQEFAAKNPQAPTQSAANKQAWNTTANELADRLESLPPETRKKLGTYNRADYDRWLAELGEAGKKNSPTLDALADGQLFKLFPSWKGKPLNPQTSGQVWYAIAESMVGNAKARKGKGSE